MNTLLPSHKKNFYKKLELLFLQRLSEIDLSKINFSPKTCDERLLPHLAAAYDVDISGFSEERARELIFNAFEIHKYAGTFYSLNNVLKSYYLGAKISEWFDYSALPYHFRLEIKSIGISKEELTKIDELVGKYKNLRSVYDGVQINLNTKSDFNIGGSILSAEDVKVYPNQIRFLNMNNDQFIGGGILSFEEVKIYPPQTAFIDFSGAKFIGGGIFHSENVKVYPPQTGLINLSAAKFIGCAVSVHENINFKLRRDDE